MTGSLGMLAAEQIRSAKRLPRAVVGFDGYIDTMVDVVDQRDSAQPRDYRRILTIEALAKRIAAAAGLSTNLEIRTRSIGPGGNGPYMAGALARLGTGVTCIGALGDASIDPVYAPLAAICEQVWSIADPARTDALEFNDGKVMLNHPDAIDCVTWERVVERIGMDSLRTACRTADFIATVNWTNLGGLPGIWQGLGEHVLDSLQSKPWIFVDLADPARRIDADVHKLIEDLRLLNSRAPVTLGLNLVECRRLAHLLGCSDITSTNSKPNPESFAQAADALCRSLQIRRVIVHNRIGAGAATAQECAHIQARTLENPLITTGAGDHFNGGFAFAAALELPLQASLLVGCETATHYTQSGVSPDRDTLLQLLSKR